MWERAATLSQNQARWYAIRTRSRCEKVVCKYLDGYGIEGFLPLRPTQRTSRKWRFLSPLFPGYCFAKFLWGERTSIVQCPGVVDVLGQGGHPVAIPDSEIDAIKTIVSRTEFYDHHPYLEEGALVEVICGPLQGLRGTFVRQASRCRLIISVHVIKQSTAIEIDADSVVSIEPSTNPSPCYSVPCC